MGLLWFLLVGLIAGSIANSVMNRGGKGLGSSLLLGVVGAFVGGPLLGLIGVRAFGFIGSIVSATIGAVLLIWIVRKLRGK
ncbi:MAG TPA: GlsB/YeaQ/YmgE family stress response membrane protein [Gemmatimonadaceae bacterium]|nr:GlsB/YeaQ/YmgE family stress response membrane protein [Gemmatimonadaceae bacterium]